METTLQDHSLAVKSADRVIGLFEYLADTARDVTHAEIASALDIPKGSLSKLLRTLARRGHVDYVPDSRGYRFGPAFLAIARRATASHDIVALSHGVLTGVMEAVGESCSLSLLRGDEIEAVAAVSAPRRLLYHLKVGDRIPLYASSGGKAILAFLPAPVRASYLARASFRALTRFSVRDASTLSAEIDLIRSDGVAFSRQEVTEGVISIGVPVLSGAGHPVAALNVAMPMVRFDAGKQRLCIAQLRAGAARLRALLGEPPPQPGD